MTARPRLHWLDLLVITVAGAGIGALLAGHWPSGAASEARIYLEGERALTLALSEDGHHRLNGPLGETLLEIRDGRIRFLEAPCNERICLRRGWLRHNGESASCIPNRVHVQLAGRERAYDSINF